MNLSDVERGKKYMHREWGEVQAIAPHPDDGSYWIVEVLDDPDNISDFRGTIADRLEPV